MKFYYGFFEKNWADEFYWLEDFICNSKHLQRLEEIKNNAKERMIIYYNPIDYEEIRNNKIKQIVCMFYMGVVFYFIASLKTIYGFLDFIILTFNISSSQIFILILITVFLGVYAYKLKKNKNCIDERE